MTSWRAARDLPEGEADMLERAGLVFATAIRVFDIDAERDLPTAASVSTPLARSKFQGVRRKTDRLV
ncbi:MAG: hypothetical protein R3D28_05815 [Geminicoccaceae bacterium]